MKQSSKRLVSLGLALFFVVASLVILFDFVQPEYSNLITAKAQVAGEQAFLDAETKAVAQAKTLISTYQNQAGDQNVSLAMPSTEDQAGALAQIYGIAQNNNISIQNITISPPTIQAQAAAPATSASGAAGGAVSAKQLVKPLAAVSFQITAAGSYESLKNFLSEIETNVRLFDLRSITVAPATSSGAAKDFFNYSISVVGYYQTH